MFIQITDEANRINLKLIPKLKAPRFVNEHDVPILIREVQSTEDWDLSLQQVTFSSNTLHILSALFRCCHL
jgi:hypothetical protein